MTIVREDFDAVIAEAEILRQTLRFNVMILEAVQRLAETAVGILRNASSTTDATVREQAQFAYSEILNQIGVVIDGSTFGLQQLLDGGVYWGFDPRFDVRLDFRGILPGAFVVEAVNLNPLVGQARDASNLQPLVALNARTEAGAYVADADGDVALSSDLSGLMAYFGAVRATAMSFNARAGELEFARDAVDRAFEVFANAEADSSGRFIGEDAGNVSAGGTEGDTILGDDSDDQLEGASGNDVIFKDGGLDSLDGGNGGDLFKGAGGGEVISGDGGDGRDAIVFGYASTEPALTWDAAWSWNVVQGQSLWNRDNPFGAEVAPFTDRSVALRGAARSDVSDLGFFNGTTLGVIDIGAIGCAWNANSIYAIDPAGGCVWRNVGAVAQGFTATAADVNDDGDTDIVFTGYDGVSFYDIAPGGGYGWSNMGGVCAGYLLFG
jgi:hypothetical protein